MKKDWWIAYPDGQKFNMSNEEIEREIRARKFPPTLMGSYQGGPYVPLHQSPNFRREFEAVAARAAAQGPIWSNLIPAGVILGSVGIVILVLFAGVIALIRTPRAPVETPSQTYSQPEQPAPPPVDTAPIEVGDKFYLASDGAFIGTVTAIQNNRTFPDGTRRHAFKVKFGNGGSDWVPIEFVERAYTVEKKLGKKTK